MTRTVFYTSAAERDLESIASFTLELWGPAQRDQYLDLLEEMCERFLPNHVGLAREVPNRSAIRRWRVESHVIYFREVRRDIEIIRILHERMLPSRHL